MARRLDDEDAGTPQRGRKSSDRRTYLRFREMVKAVNLSRILKADLNADRFSFDLDEAGLHDAECLDGKLILVTNTKFKPAEVVKRFKTLADIERGFRVLKSDLDIAAVQHRVAERIRAHALICFLALVLYRVMRLRLQANRSPLSPRRALVILRQLENHRVAISSKTVTGTGRVQLGLRELFTALQINEPDIKTAV